MTTLFSNENISILFKIHPSSSSFWPLSIWRKNIDKSTKQKEKSVLKFACFKFKYHLIHDDDDDDDNLKSKKLWKTLWILNFVDDDNDVTEEKCIQFLVNDNKWMNDEDLHSKWENLFHFKFFFWGKFCEINQRNQKYVFWVNLVSKKKNRNKKDAWHMRKTFAIFFLLIEIKLIKLTNKNKEIKKKIIQLFFPRKKKKTWIQCNFIFSFLISLIYSNSLSRNVRAHTYIKSFTANDNDDNCLITDWFCFF